MVLEHTIEIDTLMGRQYIEQLDLSRMRVLIKKKFQCSNAICSWIVTMGKDSQKSFVPLKRIRFSKSSTGNLPVVQPQYIILHPNFNPCIANTEFQKYAGVMILCFRLPRTEMAWRSVCLFAKGWGIWNSTAVDKNPRVFHLLQKHVSKTLQDTVLLWYTIIQ